MEVGVWLRHPDRLWIHSEIEERHGDKCVFSHLLIVCLILYVLKKLMICFKGAHLRVGPTSQTDAFKSLLEESAEQIRAIPKD